MPPISSDRVLAPPIRQDERDSDPALTERYKDDFLSPEQVQHLPERSLIRQLSMRMYPKGSRRDVAADMLHNVAPRRLADAERVCQDEHSSLDHEISESKKARADAWRSVTQDDSVISDQTSAKAETSEFFLSRVTDVTSYFYKFHYDGPKHLSPQKAQVQLVDIRWLKPHEQIVSWERVDGLRRATLTWDAYTEPLLVDRQSGAILDGHHRYTVALQLNLSQVPAVLVDYLDDDTITVDVWPGCGRDSLTKDEVVAMAMSDKVFPPKTSRHRFVERLPPVSIPLSVLRQPPSPLDGTTEHLSRSSSTSSVEEEIDTQQLKRRPSLTEVSVKIICGAQHLAASLTKGLFRSRLRQIENEDLRPHLDVIRRPTFDPSDFFNAIRENDPSSSFCRQRGATFEDLLSSDAKCREKFFMTRICDPTSYFYKFHFDAPPKRSPKKQKVQVAKVSWLKAHEHVVSWDRVDGLKRATLRWDAYMEPLLVDERTGAILDGHHRYHVGRQLGLECVPVVMVDYLADESITVDVWPQCGRDSLTKEEVIDMSLSDGLFPPKTSRHTFSDDLPPISVPLARLRQALTSDFAEL